MKLFTSQASDTNCAHGINTRSSTQNRFSDTSTESFFFFSEPALSYLHTALVNLTLSPQRRISNFPDPASPLVQCWHAAGSQLLLEAACESQQRQTDPPPPPPLHPTASFPYARRSGIQKTIGVKTAVSQAAATARHDSLLEVLFLPLTAWGHRECNETTALLVWQCCSQRCPRVFDLECGSILKSLRNKTLPVASLGRVESSHILAKFLKHKLLHLPWYVTMWGGSGKGGELGKIPPTL